MATTRRGKLVSKTTYMFIDEEIAFHNWSGVGLVVCVTVCGGEELAMEENVI